MPNFLCLLCGQKTKVVHTWFSWFFYRISIPPCFFLIAASGGSCYPPLLIGHFLGFRQSGYEIFSENRLFKQYEDDKFVKNAEKNFLFPNRLTILMFFCPISEGQNFPNSFWGGMKWSDRKLISPKNGSTCCCKVFYTLCRISLLWRWARNLGAVSQRKWAVQEKRGLIFI